ncbi:S8 family serine peptidase [Mycobacterium sp. pUA109]|uniref:S8 family serine peptidase n=1 Tax=Mycobacterium sp. pUA109 TaxID=3238982 RepID=UPI00351B02B4
MSSGVDGAFDNPRIEPAAGRPLLVRGETLKLAVDVTSSARRQKTWRVSIEDAAARVLAQTVTAAEALASTPDRYIGEHPILEVVLHDYALAASVYPQRLFRDCGFVHVGSAVQDNARTVYVAVPKDGLATLQQIAQGAPHAIQEIQDGIQALDTIALAHAAPREPFESPGADGSLVEIVLHGQPDVDGAPAAAGAATIDSVTAVVSSSGGTIENEWIRRNDTATFVPARIDGGGLAEVLQHNSVRICQPMPRLRQIPAPIPSGQLPLTFTLSGRPPRSGVPPLKVAVFDGGVDADRDVWQGRVVGCEIGSPVAHGNSRAHGALVTSAMLYGHLTGQVLPPPANLDITHYAAIPQEGREHDLQMYWLLDTMEKVIRSNDFDIVLVCIGPDLIVTDDHVDRWTSTIDQLSFEEDVLFVVAAGNNGELDATTRMNRVLVPADTVNGIAVGATDNPTGTTRASYSPTGPGRTSAQILPTGVAFGGAESEPFIAVDNDATPLLFQGTSCAAPLVVHGLANAATRLGLEYRTPTVLRCCAIHFADRARGQDPDHVGYGHLPSDYPEIDYTAAHVVHVLYEGQTTRGEVDVMAIPMPDGMAAPVNLRITVVSTSEVNPSDAGDYVGAGLNITLRPDTTVYTFTSPIDDKERKSLSLTRDMHKVAELEAVGWKRSAQPDTKSWTVQSKTEANRRASGKWESVQVINHKLTTAMVGPRIELQHLSRQRAVLTRGTPPLKWTMLVTLECPPGTELYQSVRAQFPTLQPHVITIEPETGTDIEATE